MHYLFILIFLAIPFTAIAQSSNKDRAGYIQGLVYDEAKRAPVDFASIRLLAQKDSSYIKGVGSDDKGRFKIEVPDGDYTLQISAISYHTIFHNFSINSKLSKYELDTVYMYENSILLNEAMITFKIPDIVVRGDTVEYNAASYLRDEGSMLRDLVRNIPGIEIDENNNVMANGKPVSKILVDGKEFFGNDIAMALTNLPANMVKKLQLFKEESKEAKISGFKDKDPPQVLNLEVKEELKRSLFGDLGGGYGNKDKSTARFMTSYMDDDNQISLVGSMGNVSSGDYVIFESGIATRKNLGLNFFKKTSENFDISSNIRYSNNDNRLETESNTETFLPTSERYSNSFSANRNKRESLTGGINISWEIDSLTTLYYNNNIGYDKTRNDTKGSSVSFTSLMDTTKGESENYTLNDGYNFNNNFTLGRRLNSKGRTLTLSGSHSYRNQDSDGNNYSINNYSDGTPDKIIDHIRKGDALNNSYSVSLSYVEPIGSNHSLRLSYAYSNNYSKQIQDARKKDEFGEYAIIDTAYSRNTRTRQENQNISLDFQAQKEKFNYTVGISLDPTKSNNHISLGDSIIENLRQTAFNFSPNLYVNYNPNQSSSLDFSYYGSSRQASTQQLSSDTVIVSSMLKYYGNPNLKQSYDNNLSINFHKSEYEKNRYFMLGGGFNYTFNDIVNYTDIDSRGNSVSTYKNVNGNMGTYLSASYNTPLRNDKFTLNTNTSSNYTRNIGYTNSEKTTTQNISMSEYLRLNFKLQKFETEVKAHISYSIARNNITTIDNKSTSNYGFSNYTMIKLPFDFTIRNTISYSKYNGYGSGFKSNEILWNASIDKLLLKNKKGTLKLQFFDILKDRSNVIRHVSSNYISDYRTNTQSRYALLSFSYKFNVLKTGK